MTSDKPLVSICIPNYNNGPYLAQAIESALQQTVQDIEVIVCDNQSTDNSLEVLRSFTDSRVRVYVNERNLGIYGNFARTTVNAQGKYLKFLCADDWLEPDYLEVTLGYFEKYAEAGLVSTRQVAITNEGNVFTVREEAVRGKEIYSPFEYLSAVLRRINPIGNPTRVIVRHNVFDAVGGFDPRNEYAGDMDLWMRIAAEYSIVAVPRVLCYERKHIAQATNSHVKAATDIRDICLAFEKSIQELPKFWTLDRRIALCRYGLGSFVRHALIALFSGDLNYGISVMKSMSILSPSRYWIPYHAVVSPYLILKAFLYEFAQKIGIKRVKYGGLQGRNNFRSFSRTEVNSERHE